MLTHHPERLAGTDPLVEALSEARDELGALADADLTEERLAAQRAAILQRLAKPQQGSHVLAFPARTGVSRSTRPAARWLAAAAAAGLVVGLGAGELSVRLFELTPPPARPAESRPAWEPTGPAVMTAELHDEAFLAEMEVTLNDRGVFELRALDALTPRATTTSTRDPR